MGLAQASQRPRPDGGPRDPCRPRQSPQNRTQNHNALLENGVLSVLREWLKPLPDKSLPNLNVRPPDTRTRTRGSRRPIRSPSSPSLSPTAALTGLRASPCLSPTRRACRCARWCSRL